MSKSHYLFKAIQAALAAGEAVLDIYHSNFDFELKNDKPPLTVADKSSHNIIAKYLSDYDLPILSEEGINISFEERKNWNEFWLVDPLDGTKEFIKKNGEFTVNIALIKNNMPILGVIFAPDKNALYFAERYLGAYQLVGESLNNLISAIASHNSNPVELNKFIGQASKLPCNLKDPSTYVIVGSRSHADKVLEAFVEETRQHFNQVEFISAGSSLKFCNVAEGKADIYPRLGPTMEWDTAAGQIIAESAGAKVNEYNSNEPLVYNKMNLKNPWFTVSRAM